MDISFKQMQESAAFIQSAGIDKPQVGIILGTGLGGLIKDITIQKEIDYADIPHFPVSTVESHKGKLIYGELAGKSVLAMSGRFHYYEGYSMQQITLPVRVMKLLGVQNLLISNAAGAVNLRYKKGTLMLLDDHINLLPENPLTGKNIDELGPRFPDMSQPFNKQLNELMLAAAKEEAVVLHQGVYASVPGPNLETRAEYRYIKSIGSDAVGMSTVPEVIVANHMGLPCIAVSVLTDECDPDNLHPVSLQEILDVAASAEKGLIKLFKRLVAQL
ncbi:purine-nucleoside phosphorylase [Carboxylicivirga sp. M1479]|uniref:purine-nucleoside phosphorylase n=1 Tax=Carboxylicivirga sp. M1479 TaxID=2594476 RepID=UPI001177605F|nr:purine-nucleoside phosphorylase [Carboxylicivirga sp. M1479]TRX72619.1 purine-nucleoside phosphorylase [Carboxylicivirga sp. M1479]